MQTKTQEVRSASIKVGEAEYQVFDSTTEAVQLLGEDVVLAKLNAQVRTDAMNQVRAAAVGKPSKDALKAKAITELMADPSVFSSVVGDEAGVLALINKKVKEIEARMAAAKPKTNDEEDDQPQA